MRQCRGLPRRRLWTAWRTSRPASPGCPVCPALLSRLRPARPPCQHWKTSPLTASMGPMGSRLRGVRGTPPAVKARWSEGNPSHGAIACAIGYSDRAAVSISPCTSSSARSRSVSCRFVRPTPLSPCKAAGNSRGTTGCNTRGWCILAPVMHTPKGRGEEAKRLKGARLVRLVTQARVSEWQEWCP